MLRSLVGSEMCIRDSYYSIPIHQDCKKILKFEHDNQLYMFKALPNGYTAGPRKFNKSDETTLSQIKTSRTAGNGNVGYLM